MQYDKQTNPKARPLIPTLSTTTKTTKPSLTSRIAGSPQPYVSPNTRPGPLAELDTTPRGASNEGISTPVKAFLSSNITPRSGSRKARVDSASTTPTATPNGTPNSSRPTSMVDVSRYVTNGSNGIGLGLSGAGNGKTIRPRSMISEGGGSDLGYSKLSSGIEGNHEYGRIATSPERSPMFFHASDAGSSVSSQGPLHRSNLQHKAASVVESIGLDSDDSRFTLPPNRAATLPVKEQPRTKFFHANDIPVTKETVPKAARAGRELPSTPSPRLAAFNPHSKPQLQPRPPSPLKEQRVSRSSSLKKVSPRNYTPLVYNTTVHQIELVSPPGHVAGQTELGRRSSISTPAARRVSHAKSNSVSSLDSNPVRRRSLRLPDPPASVSTLATSRASSDAWPEYATTDNVTAEKDTAGSMSMPQSPTEIPQAQNKLQQMNELAANARRERKVLDLEISNSSLLAINRTLEREMRKQNNELRRYRRLSRSGRLSMAPSLRSISAGGLSMLSETDTASDFSSLPEDDAGDDLYSDDESLLDDGTFSPNTYAEHDARLRAKDEKRLQLDLSKHRELLVDSQRMNQSIKRCLGWTEDLIKECQKALDYRVRVSDFEVGGRVLTPDDVDVDIEADSPLRSRRGLLSPALEAEDPLAEVDPSLEAGHHFEGEELGRQDPVELKATAAAEKSGMALGLGEYLHNLGHSLRV